MKNSKSPLYLFPLVFSLGFALLLLWVAGPPKDKSDWVHFSVTFICSYGIWCLIFALSQWLYQRSRYWLFFLIPAFLGVILSQAFQLVHLYLFENYVTLSRFTTILMHLYLIFPELFRNFSEFGWSIPISITAGLAVLFLSFLKFSKTQIFRPFKMKAMGSALITALSLVWLALPLSHNLNFSYQMPDVAGTILSVDYFIRKFQYIFASKTKSYLSQSEGFIERKGVPPLDIYRLENSGQLPNIIIVLLESVRSDHLSIYGYHRETTPFLKSISQTPAMFHFKHAYANSTVSYFSLVSLTSGKALKRPLEQFETTPLLWDFLKTQGYDTSFITQSLGYPLYFLDAFLQTPGLDFYRDIGQESLQKYDQQDFGYLEWFKKKRFKSLFFPRNDAWSLNALKDRLKTLPKDRPFFSVWELECTHEPYCYSEEFKKYLPVKVTIPSRKNIESFRNNYDNAVLYSDHMIKSLFDFLKEQGLYDNTIVVITSDHGEAFFEHGQIFHGENYYYQEVSKVPFLLYIPEALTKNYSQATLENLRNNQESIVQLIDMVPTILGLTTGKYLTDVQEHFDGHNLLQALPKGREIFISNAPPSFMTRHQKTALHSIVTSNFFQWIIHPDPRKSELYDLQSDPKQQWNLLEKFPEKYLSQIPKI